MIATIVDSKALLDTVIASSVAGIATTIIFSLTILGAARFGDASREGRTLEAAFFGVLAAAGALATVGAAVVAVIVMTSK